ncbi:MAG TPA: AAA family ATPase [Candidatus Hydrogenedentes bacterium]|mgnify:CR=1 FL=1|nr:AAA family ATPase [Candidatus Hydrogenedentota bacterium]
MAGFQTASRKKAKLRLGVIGPSGSGKTMSSLLIAYGITGDWNKIGLVDTERGSGELYAGSAVGEQQIGDYQVLTLQPPYEPEKYIQAIKLAEAAGLECVILDSLSHAWAGEGGLLDRHDKITKASKSGNSYTAWRDITPLHNRLIDAMLSSPLHVIATMRSKTEYVQEESGGKKVVRKVGMAPVQREGMDYEFTVVIELTQDHIAVASKDRTSLFDGKYFTPASDTGLTLKGWLETGTDPDTEAKEKGLAFCHAKAADRGMNHDELKALAGEIFGRCNSMTDLSLAQLRKLGKILNEQKASGE